MRARGVCSVERSGNEKTGQTATTYVSRESCRGCPLWDVCYGTGGKVSMVLQDLERRAQADKLGPMELAHEEAAQLDGMDGKRPCRLHVTGDCKWPAAARIVAGAAARYRARHGQAVWTYTHFWADVPRAEWGEVSVLASCETAGEVRAAHARGYATATVEGQDIAETLKSDGFRVIPCPAQTRDNVNCASCRLCWRDGLLKRNKLVVSFAAHGFRARMTREVVAAKRAAEQCAA